MVVTTVLRTGSAHRWPVGAAVASCLGAVLLLTCGCAPGGPPPAAAAGTGGAVATPATPTVPSPVVSVQDGTAGTRTAGTRTAGTRTAGAGPVETVSYRTPVTLVVTDGSFTSVRVDGKKGTPSLDGTMSGDGRSWVSQERPRPLSAYTVTAGVKDSAGKESTRTLTFSVAAVPSSQRVAFTVTPKDGSTVGIGQPIVVRFLVPIKERAAYEKVMEVTARTSAGKAVAGSWNWLNSQEVHWRPKAFWTPGTKVTLDMRIAGVKAAPDRYGRRNYSQTFTIGASHITRVDGASHRVTVYRDGKRVADWPGGTGRPGLETYSGTYIVLGKSAKVMMDSCSARITCDEKDPDYYSEEEYWATRVTASGTFLHAAGWDGLLGRANVSHGCIHLSDTSARDFYDHAVIGDVVIVSRTGRGPQERIASQDPGLYDWNVSWSQWVAGSALH